MPDLEALNKFNQFLSALCAFFAVTCSSLLLLAVLFALLTVQWKISRVIGFLIALSELEENALVFRRTAGECMLLLQLSILSSKGFGVNNTSFAAKLDTDHSLCKTLRFTLSRAFRGVSKALGNDLNPEIEGVSF